MKRNTVMRGRAPYFPGSPDKEAAKFLMNVSRRYITDKANVDEVNEAVAAWQVTVGVKEP